MAAGLLLSSLALGALGVFPLPAVVSDFLANVTGIRQSTMRALLDPVSGKIQLSLLPTGHGNGFDADTLDGRHASSFALTTDLDAVRSALQIEIGGLPTATSVDLSPYLKKTGTAADSSKLGGQLPGFYQNAGSLSAGSLSDLRLSGNVALIDLAQTFTGTKTFAVGLTVSGGALTLPTASVADSALSANVALLSGSQTFTGTKSFAALLTATSGFTLSTGALSLPGNSIIDAALSANVALLTGTQTFSGAKTFSAAITAPTSGNSLNGLIVNSGALSGVTTLTASGALTAATASNTLNGIVVSSGNATLANLTSSTGSLTSTVADSGTAVGFVLGTSTTYATAGAKLLQLKNNATVALTIDKDGNLTAGGNIVATGTLQGTQLISTVATGTAPLVVTSTTQVTNLNANFVQGFQASDLYSVPQPNLIPNSDFGRRTKWMTFMPETFADTNGYQQIDAGSAPTVASNTLTQAAANNEVAWPKVDQGTGFWRDVRVSAQFKLVVAAGMYRLKFHYFDANNYYYVRYNGVAGSLEVRKVIGGTDSLLNNVAQGTTLNNWYWLEIESQGAGTSIGSTLVGKLYNSGTSPVSKSSAALLVTVPYSIANDSAVPGGRITISSDQTNTQWGGLNTGDGGVYVEGWGPESWPVDWTQGGTLGGQAVGFDEAADAGPINKQWALRFYIPAASRSITLPQTSPNGSLVPGVAYTYSLYVKTSGKVGPDALARIAFTTRDPALTQVDINVVADAGETAWTRKSSTLTAAGAAARLFRSVISINAFGTTTGTGFLMLPQIEQGSVATSWRNAPEDFATIEAILPATSIALEPDATTTGGTFSDVNPGRLAMNFFAPYDSELEITLVATVKSTVVGDTLAIDAFVDGATAMPNNTGGTGSAYLNVPNTNYWTLVGVTRTKVAAGKHRVAANFKRNGGTGTVNYAITGIPLAMYVRATKGK